MSDKDKGLTEADLEKGLARLEAAAKAPSRAQELFSKAQSGTATPEERDELLKSLGGGSPLAQETTDALRKSQALADGLEVSDFLNDLHKGLLAGLELLAGRMEKGESAGQDFRVALATTMLSTVDMVKSVREDVKALRDDIKALAGQPARAPKSQGVPAQPLNKAFAPQVAQPAAGQLSKAEIEDTMTAMLAKGMTLVGGEPLLVAATKYETTSSISPAVLAEVMAFRGGKNKAA